MAKAEPDGYTLLLHHIGMATCATLYRKLPYDPLNAFEPIGLVADVPMMLVARKDLAAGRPQGADRVRQGQQGQGDLRQRRHRRRLAPVRHAVHERDRDRLTTVPYKGTGPAMTDLIGGQVDMMCDQTTNTTNQIKAGKIKAYAVTTRSASRRCPTSRPPPTGPRLEVAVWHGLYAPKGTPEGGLDRSSPRSRRRCRIRREGAPRRTRHRAGRRSQVTPAALKAQVKPRSTGGSRSSRRPATSPTERSAQCAQQ